MRRRRIDFAFSGAGLFPFSSRPFPSPKKENASLFLLLPAISGRFGYGRDAVWMIFRRLCVGWFEIFLLVGEVFLFLDRFGGWLVGRVRRKGRFDTTEPRSGRDEGACEFKGHL